MNRNYKWWVVAMLWFVCFFNYADRQAIFSVFPLLQKEMGLSDVQLGVVGAAFMWVYAASAPLAGIIGDRFKRKTLILGGLIFWSIVTVATAFSQNYTHLVICRALEGFGEAFYFPASMALLSDYHGKETRSRAMSIHQSSVYAGTIAGGSVAGIMGDLYQDWRPPFYFFGWLGVLLGIVLLLLLREPRRGASEEMAEENTHASLDLKRAHLWAEILAVLQTPMVRILMIVFVGANFVAMIFLTWMPSYLFKTFRMSLSMSGVSATIYLQIASVLGVLSGGWLADRLVRRYRGGRMMTQAVGLLLGVPFVFLTGWTLSIPVLVLAMIGFGYFKGFYDANIWASLHDVVRPERRATAVGLMNAIGWFGGGLAPVAIAAASQRYGMSACLSANSLVYLLVGSILVLGILRYMRSPKSGWRSSPA
ncbi:MAG: spinster family MFS transporter [Blastocatellia bacterium]